eukprot:CAMPEP_0197030300 /NCGR_PEP_ID=MMETSP1384-20130603/9558_1 /TAXON_ID=29189 /ORGANISM="Ammonia sp." /LENGTH=614 /DNA_ID=CAMNT_0042459617 /DNA_START=12 /DNA_END=1856 /DNA_ORIENTATION=+
MTAAKPQPTKEKIAHDTLCRFIHITVQKNNQNNLARLMKELDCITSYKPESIRKWYLALTDCVPFLHLDRYRNLWFTIFERFRWDFPSPTLDAYCTFCTVLISQHPVAIKPVLQTCIANFIDRFHTDKCPSNQKMAVDHERIHRLLQQIHVHRPTVTGLLMSCLVDLFPNMFTEDTHIIGGYVQQLLSVIQYIPELRPQIIQLIVEKMILIDVELDKRDKQHHGKPASSAHGNAANNEESKYETNDPAARTVSDDHEDSVVSDEREDCEDKEDGMAVSDEEDDHEEEDKLATNLDQLMCLMFDYIKIIADDHHDLLNEVYQTMSRIFESTILSTHEITSVQFIMFYLCSFRSQFAEEFVSRLMKLCTDTHRPSHERCFAAGYIGGYVSKAKYLRHMSAFTAFDILIQWLLAYTQIYKKQYPFVANIGPREAKNHQLFYAVCQAVFRIYAHHQHTFDSMFQTNSKIPHSIYQITQCCLQPFKYCHGVLVLNFIISVKQSAVLDVALFPAFNSSKNVFLAATTFTNWNLFPFDSYNLYHSSAYLHGLFRILGEMSPMRRNEHDMDEDQIKSEVDPKDALTPTLGPCNHTSMKGVDHSDDEEEEEEDEDDEDDDFLI